MATKKSSTKKSTKTSKATSKKVAYHPMQITFGVAVLAGITLVVFALVLAVQIQQQ